MTDITVVTTFHKPGLEQYGQRFLDSFAQRVDKKIKLLVYAEACQPVNPDPEQIKIFDSFVGVSSKKSSVMSKTVSWSIDNFSMKAKNSLDENNV